MSKRKEILEQTSKEIGFKETYLEGVLIEEELAKAEVLKANANLKAVRRRKSNVKKDIKELEEVVEKLE